MNLMGSGFSAINIGDEIIEINKQVVVSLFCFFSRHKKISFHFLLRLVGIRYISIHYFDDHLKRMKFVYS